MQYNTITVGKPMDDATFTRYLMQDNIPMKIWIKGRVLQPYDIRFTFQKHDKKFGGLVKMISFGNFFRSHTDIHSIEITEGKSDKRKSNILVFFDSQVPQIKENSVAIGTIDIDGVSTVTVDKADKQIIVDKFLKAAELAGINIPLPSKAGTQLAVECRIVPIEGKDHFLLQIDKLQDYKPGEKIDKVKDSYAPAHISNKSEPSTDILDRIRAATPSKGHFIIDVTPEIAEDMMMWNTHNRQLRLEHIFRYAKDMAEDKWVFNNESTLGFSHELKLIDGQSRLLAIIKSGTTQKMVIFTGLPPESISVLNSGRSRSQGDTLSLQNIKEPNKNAPAVSMIIYMQKYGKPQSVSKKDDQVTNQDLDEFLRVEENYKRFNELLEELDKVWRNYGKRVVKRHVWLAMYFLLSKIRKEDAKEFMTLLVTGENIGKKENSAIYYAHTALRMWGNLKAQASGKKGTFQQFYVMITAWNHYIKGEEIPKLAIDYDATELPKIDKK